MDKMTGAFKGLGRFSAPFKVLFIAILMLLFLIPLSMIRGVIREREYTRNDAENEIIGLWGGEQVIAGPVLVVPYHYREKDNEGRWVTHTNTAYFLPETLDIQGTVSPETRNRGIYDVTVYTSDLLASGHFLKPDFSKWHIAEADILWDDAYLTVEFPDMRGLRERASVMWGGRELGFEAGSGTIGFYSGSMSTPIGNLAAAGPGTSLDFVMDLRLRGGRSLSFVPLGQETRIGLSSSWASPSFMGAFLPSERKLDEEGFRADWYVLALARNYPQKWRAGQVDLAQVPHSAFGVNLMIPVDTYHKAERSVKYGLLFILLPFLTFFLFEVFLDLRIHVMQYLLVGFANSLFYLLLLSISEHLGFVPAYLLGSGGTIVLITIYSAAVLSTWRRGITMAPVLAASYVFLYVVLQSEDYALVIGSVGLFAILAVLMIGTRKVNWYKFGRSRDQESGSFQP